MEKKIVKIFPGNNEISFFLMNEWETSQNNAIKNKGYFTVALSGGNTPVPFFQKLSEQKNRFTWNKTFIFQVDERYVNFNHNDNNYKMIKENLFDKINIPENNIFPINTSLPFKESALDYEKQVRFFFKNESHPGFDLILLGIGTDGHTASLFPGNKVLNENKKITAVVEDKNINHKRITLTYPIINNSKKVIFLATGKNKTQIIKEIIEEKNKNYPASRVNPVNGDLIYVLDKDAGKGLINIS